MPYLSVLFRPPDLTAVSKKYICDRRSTLGRVPAGINEGTVHRGVAGSSVGKEVIAVQNRLCDRVSVIQESINMVRISIIGVLFRGMSTHT
jgi:hypothetical protein